MVVGLIALSNVLHPITIIKLIPISVSKFQINNTFNNTFCDIKAKQPESGDLCGNITEFGVAEWSPEPAGQWWSFHHPKWSDIAIQYTRRRLFCFYILLFNGFKSFQAKIYEINMYLLLYFFFFQSQCRNTSHCNKKVTWATL